MSNLRSAEQIIDIIGDLQFEDSASDDIIECAFIPNAECNDEITSHSSSHAIGHEIIAGDNDDIDEENMAGGLYDVLHESYSAKQTLLEERHDYNWIDGEINNSFDLENKIFLSNDQVNKIKSMSKLEIFEMFFCNDLKLIIIDATRENLFDLSIDKFNRFVGILMLTIYNSRKKLRDYWSDNDLLSCKRVQDCMSRDTFLEIKSKLKFARANEQNLNDKVWRVRKFVERFRKNLRKFGFFSSNMSVDESMIKFFGRCAIKQFMPLKPIRFGIKLWSLCTIAGFLLDFQIYCGKETGPSHDKLQNCTLGSKAVMQVLHEFLKSTPADKLKDYHIAIDNFFTSPDLLVHLKNIGLKATGTVRANRVYMMNEKPDKKGKLKITRETVKINLDNKSERGSWSVKHDVSSKINYVSVKDNKVVSILSSAAGVTPCEPVLRWSKTEKKKVKIDFPHVFSVYNKTMGGVDLHDQHCSDLNIKVKSDKWTWAIFRRVIEASISNAFILWRQCANGEEKKNVGAKEFVLEISDKYILPDTEKLQNHNICSVGLRRICKGCTKPRVFTYCIQCAKHYCIECFNKHHDVVVHTSSPAGKRKPCSNDKCNKRTTSVCKECDSNICTECFDEYHKIKRIKSL